VGGRLKLLGLSEAQYHAVLEAKRQLKQEFPVEKLIVFGSVARGEADEESDLDLLVITSEPATHRIRNRMSDVIFEINLKYGTNLSIVVVEKSLWNEGILSLTPFYEEVQREGVSV